MFFLLLPSKLLALNKTRSPVVSTIRPTVCRLLLASAEVGKKNALDLRPATEMPGGKEDGHAKKMRPSAIQRALKGQFFSDVLYTWRSISEPLKSTDQCCKHCLEQLLSSPNWVSVSMLWCPRTCCPPTLRCRSTTSLHPVATRQDTMPRDMTVVKSFSKKISPSRKGGIRASLALDSLIDSEIVKQPSPRSITRFSSHNLKQDERTQEKVRHKPGQGCKSSATPSLHSQVGKLLSQEVYIGACA